MSAFAALLLRVWRLWRTNPRLLLRRLGLILRAPVRNTEVIVGARLRYERVNATYGEWLARAGLRFEYRGAGAGPAPSTAQRVVFRDLPPDIRVNGAPQCGTDQPVWATFGGGWHEVDPREGRWARAQAHLILYSTEARRVRLRAMPVNALAAVLGPQRLLQVTTNGAAAQVAPLQAGTPLELELALVAGWNDIALIAEGGEIQPARIIPGNPDPRLLSFELANIEIVTK